MWTLSFTRVGPIWGRFWASWAPSWIPETAPNRRNIYPSPLLASKMASGPDIEKHYRTAVKDYFWRTMSVEASNQSDCDTLFGASLNRCKIAAKTLRSESVKNRSLEPRGGGPPQRRLEFVGRGPRAAVCLYRVIYMYTDVYHYIL